MRAFRQTEYGWIETCLKGKDLLANPLLNKGVAFTQEERRELGLGGLLPPAVMTIEEQVQRVYEQLQKQPDNLHKNIALNDLFHRNVILYYRLLSEHLSEMLPIVYTPTVGQAIQAYSHEYHRPGGVYLSINDPEGIARAFQNVLDSMEHVDLIVATDSESILGIGDWGVGGINISIGKLAVYTAAAGIDPGRVLAVVLDVGTDNANLLEDPLYMGNRHARVRGHRYEQFIDRFVQEAVRSFPDVLLHWEDLGSVNARQILNKYAGSLLTFNDDIQGTGAVTLAAVKSACRLTNTPLTEQRVLIFGPGSAGIGNADQICAAMVEQRLSPDEARRCFWAYDQRGLLLETTGHILDYQLPYVREEAECLGWQRDEAGLIPLLEVVRRVKPTILIGTSGVPGAFTEEIVREMARHAERPVILPMSNPTALAEAVPADLLAWTEGRALIATGSPFGPVELNGVRYEIAQSNNALVFPGLGLGAIVVKAKCLTPGMFSAAAEAIAAFMAEDGAKAGKEVQGRVDLHSLGQGITGQLNMGQERLDQEGTDKVNIGEMSRGSLLLPRVDDLREVSLAVAAAVAYQAIEEDIAGIIPQDVEAAIRGAVWQCTYKPIKAAAEPVLV